MTAADTGTKEVDERRMTPHRCPVCEGRCVVPLGFYNGYAPENTTAGALTEMCRACIGAGVLWH